MRAAQENAIFYEPPKSIKVYNHVVERLSQFTDMTRLELLIDIDVEFRQLCIALRPCSEDALLAESRLDMEYIHSPTYDVEVLADVVFNNLIMDLKRRYSE